LTEDHGLLLRDPLPLGWYYLSLTLKEYFKNDFDTWKKPFTVHGKGLQKEGNWKKVSPKILIFRPSNSGQIGKEMRKPEELVMLSTLSS
jgi:hypothetical protein